MIAARHNLLPTKHNIEKWYDKPTTQCTCGCKGAEHQTLCHLLNSCGFQRQGIITRHDQVINVIKQVIAENNEQAEVTAENQQIDGVEGANKPDLVITTEQKIFIIDVTCPYGGAQETRRSLNTAYNKKLEKYEPLRTRLHVTLDKEAIIIPIVVSSLGIVHKKSIQEFKKHFQLDDNTTKRMNRKISVTALKGSYQIWLKHVRDQHPMEERDLTAEEREEEHLMTELRSSEDEHEEEEFEIAPISDFEPDEINPNEADEHDLDPVFQRLFEDASDSASESEHESARSQASD